MGNFENFVKFTAEYLILNRSQASCARDCTSNACMQIESMLFNFSKKILFIIVYFCLIKERSSKTFRSLIANKNHI